MIGATALVVIAHSTAVAGAQLETYPAPTANFPSGPFTVSVSQSEGTKGEAAAQDSFVYVTKQGGLSQSWTTFSYAGATATVAVTPAMNWSTWVLRPLSLGLVARRQGSAVVFALPISAAPAKVIVEFDGAVNNALAIFGDPLLANPRVFAWR